MCILNFYPPPNIAKLNSHGDRVETDHEKRSQKIDDQIHLKDDLKDL